MNSSSSNKPPETDEDNLPEEYTLYRQMKMAMHRMTGTYTSSSFLEPTGYVDLTDVEQASLDRPISDSNVGFRLLSKMGWQSGQGLGREQQGRVDPIPLMVKQDVMGLGLEEHDNAMHLAATAGPRLLESERQILETDAERIERQLKVEKQQEIKKELNEISSVFYCELCDKRYQKVSEWENHLSSYDHNHKKRFTEMKQATRKVDGQKQRDKEKRRMEKELARVQAASMHREAASRTNDASNEVKQETTTTTTTTTTSVASTSTTRPAKTLSLFNKKVSVQYNNNRGALLILAMVEW
ncbi:hypothetical protein BDF22DRAFT_695110 [Syncephalis plumigaleata]|nr:hypothetical protein BDF22DRAFT_695110 [Syncephalis plumigaleata]